MKKLLLLFLCFLSGATFAGEKRVVSLSPALTELVCHLKMEKCLVGRSVSCDRPSQVKQLPAVGDFARPDLEKLAKFSLNSPKRLTGLKFTEFFLWLSRSVSCVSKAAPNADELFRDIDDWNEQ